mgnify:CR=1 FL=1
MKVIGLTGGIGSGKSTVARMFELLNVPVYYADREAKNLMNSAVSLKLGIVQLFGEKAYANNVLNRGYNVQPVPLLNSPVTAWYEQSLYNDTDVTTS